GERLPEERANGRFEFLWGHPPASLSKRAPGGKRGMAPFPATRSASFFEVTLLHLFRDQVLGLARGPGLIRERLGLRLARRANAPKTHRERIARHRDLPELAR